MKPKRIIACLDVANGRVVKGKKFQNVQDVADPLTLAKQYDRDGADELVFYDITATIEKRNMFLSLIEDIAAAISIPFTVGGGIKSVADVEQLLNAGANKVSINSTAVTNPKILKEAADRFGSEAVSLAIDAKKIGPEKWNAYINGGKKDTKLDVIEWAQRAEQLGVGEIVLNSMDTDGVKDGYNIELNKLIAEAVHLPIVASGGAGKLEHFKAALTDGKAAGALAASVFHYGDITIPELKQYLRQQQISVTE